MRKRGFLLVGAKVEGERSSPSYSAVQAALIRRGGWFPLPLPLVKRVGRPKAMVLSYLLMLGKVRSSDDGWIDCDGEYMKSGIGYEEAVQELLLSQLETDGWLVWKNTPEGGRLIKLHLRMFL